VTVEIWVSDCVGLLVWLPLCVWDAVWVGEGDSVCERLWVWLADCVSVGVFDWLCDGVAVCDEVREPVAVLEGVMVCVGVLVDERLRDVERDTDFV
jgi:hypothetical protein